MKLSCALLLAASSVLLAADQPQSVIAKVYDGQFKMADKEFVSLAEAMPADKYDFAPTAGTFKGVRTFGAQVKHVAAVIYLVSASVLGESVPAEAGTGENGPASAKTKDEIVKYLKGAMAYGHKAMNSLTETNEVEMVKSAFGDEKTPRLGMASSAIWHTFDHYGQMVVYARMNNVVPPASRN